MYPVLWVPDKQNFTVLSIQIISVLYLWWTSSHIAVESLPGNCWLIFSMPFLNYLIEQTCISVLYAYMHWSHIGSISVGTTQLLIQAGLVLHFFWHDFTLS